MSRVKHIKWSLDFVHRALRDACNGTNEQIHFVPESGSHSIAWCLWHTTRIEDLIINLVIRESDTVWDEDWANKTGLPFDGFGTGQTDEDAQKVEISDMKASIASLTNDVERIIIDIGKLEENKNPLAN